MVVRDTPWPDGTPCWVDLGASDIPKAISFYSAQFGWDIEPGGAEVGGYSIAHRDGRIVAAVGPKMGSPDQPSAWTTYLATDDADATHAQFAALGVDVDPEVSRMGDPVPPMFWFRDPTGHSLMVVEQT